MQQLTKAKKRERFWKQLKKQKSLHLILILAVVYLIIFNYIPMAGLLMAFEDYSFAKGIFGSPWIGFDNFELFFSSYYFKDVLLNTFYISLYSLVVGFGMPIVFALLVHSLGKTWYSKLVKVLSVCPL